MTRALTPRDIDAFQRDGVVLILGAFGPDRHDIFSEPMQPGNALIFSAWIIHAAPSNTSERTRAAVSTR